MLFHSPVFIIFFVTFLAGFFIFKGQLQIVYTCVASFIFYAWWYPPYILLLLGLTLFTHFACLKQVKSSLALVLIILIGFLPLLVFKYANFALSTLQPFIYIDVLPEDNWSLPIGISFITFTAIAYVLDVRAERIEKPTSIWTTGLFISFFPQLIAGPILRAKELIPQLHIMSIRLDRIKLFCLLFAIGAFKKVGVADQLAPFVDNAYTHVDEVDQLTALIAIYAFSIQIYCDFSGYTDMALALAALLNVTLPINFFSPYGATSIRDFWRRWHITLSRWLRDYLYIPLGGSHVSLARTVGAAIMTMALGGLWHGAGWSFIIWGVLHGVLVSIEHVFSRLNFHLPVPDWLKTLVVFHIVTILWVFFRAATLDDVGSMLQVSLLGPWNITKWSFTHIGLILTLCTLVLIGHAWDRLPNIVNLATAVPAAVVVPFALMVALICSALSVNNPSAFIYFDF
jgi:alginate O-acetyltransferase complex protein AlgI